VAAVPTVDAVRAWLKVSVAAVSDADLSVILLAEQASQAAVCRIGDVPDDLPDVLVLALYRRCGRSLAARALSLGVMQSEEFGPSKLPMYDSEIERLEGPLRKVVFG
jgi:hypothetical protein